jgi:hypothetical protein
VAILHLVEHVAQVLAEGNGTGFTDHGRTILVIDAIDMVVLAQWLVAPVTVRSRPLSAPMPI